MNTDIRIFRNVDCQKCRDEYDTFIRNVTLRRPKYNTMAIYFDEEDDEYKTTTITKLGKKIQMDFFSWDEVSQYIYEMT